MGPSSCRITSSGLPLVLHYGELYNYFILHYNVIVIEIKCTVNGMSFNHLETILPPWSPWKNCLPQNQPLVPKRLRSAAVHQKVAGSIPNQDRYLGCGFDLQSGHIREATNQCFSFSHQCFLSLSLSQINKHILGWGLFLKKVSEKC